MGSKYFLSHSLLFFFPNSHLPVALFSLWRQGFTLEFLLVQSSLRSPGWPQTHSKPPASTSPVFLFPHHYLLTLNLSFLAAPLRSTLCAGSAL